MKISTLHRPARYRRTPALPPALAALLLLSVLVAGSACTKPTPERGCRADSECAPGEFCDDDYSCRIMSDAPDTGPSPDAGTTPDEDASSPPADTEEPDVTEPDPEDISDPGTECSPDAPVAAAVASSEELTSSNHLEVEPFTKIRLDPADSRPGAAEIVEYRWKIVDQPYQGDVPGTTPRFRVSDRGVATFDAQYIGAYTVELDVVDAQGRTSCAPHRITVEAKTSARIFVELVWETPGAPENPREGADLDLHYRHPEGDWGLPDMDLDIFWYVPTADWGIPGDPSDDPHLLNSVEAAPGPESVVHPNAEPLTYSVGVYYYSDAGWGPSYITIRAYINGQLAGQIEDVEMPATKAFLEALSIDAATNEITYDMQLFDDYPPLRN